MVIQNETKTPSLFLVIKLADVKAFASRSGFHTRRYWPCTGDKSISKMKRNSANNLIITFFWVVLHLD